MYTLEHRQIANQCLHFIGAYVPKSEAPRSAREDMKELYAWWRAGWGVLFRYLWFSLVLSVMLLPVSILQHFVMRDTDAGIINEMLEDSFRVGPAVLLLVIVLYGPLAFLVAGRTTGYFQGSSNETQIGIGTPLARRPSHTTDRTDHVSSGSAVEQD